MGNGIVTSVATEATEDIMGAKQIKAKVRRMDWQQVVFEIFKQHGAVQEAGIFVPIEEALYFAMDLVRMIAEHKILLPIESDLKKLVGQLECHIGDMQRIVDKVKEKP